MCIYSLIWCISIAHKQSTCNYVSVALIQSMYCSTVHSIRWWTPQKYFFSCNISKSPKFFHNSDHSPKDYLHHGCWSKLFESLLRSQLKKSPLCIFTGCTFTFRSISCMYTNVIVRFKSMPFGVHNGLHTSGTDMETKAKWGQNSPISSWGELICTFALNLVPTFETLKTCTGVLHIFTANRTVYPRELEAFGFQMRLLAAWRH